VHVDGVLGASQSLLPPLLDPELELELDEPEEPELEPDDDPELEPE
jgi:hypothetical protein